VLIGIPGLPAQAPFRSVGLAQFDGKGNLTWLEHTVVNGTLLEADWPAAGGTYSVNANCTESAMVNTPNSPVPLKLAFVVVKEREGSPQCARHKRDSAQYSPKLTKRVVISQ
jgi:hypothetical protein